MIRTAHLFLSDRLVSLAAIFVRPASFDEGNQTKNRFPSWGAHYLVTFTFLSLEVKSVNFDLMEEGRGTLVFPKSIHYLCYLCYNSLSFAS